MSSRLVAVVLLTTLGLLLSGCGGGPTTPPRNLQDACSIASERPTYYRAMQRTEAKWGIPVHVQMAAMHQESKFVGNARTPHRYVLGVLPMGRQSSAYGYSQALDSTWDEYRKETGRRGAKRDRISDATDFMGWYMNGTAERLGISKWDAEKQYLAYHEGRTGFARQSYLDKPWLVDVASKVGQRAEMYRGQLEYCR